MSVVFVVLFQVCCSPKSTHANLIETEFGEEFKCCDLSGPGIRYCKLKVLHYYYLQLLWIRYFGLFRFRIN